MSIWFNGKEITKNQIIGSFIIAIGVMTVSLVSNGAFYLFGEITARLLPQWLSPNPYQGILTEAWIGGVIAQIGLLTLFGRKGSGLQINESIVTHETRSQEAAQ